MEFNQNGGKKRDWKWILELSQDLTLQPTPKACWQDIRPREWWSYYSITWYWMKLTLVTLFGALFFHHLCVFGSCENISISLLVDFNFTLWFFYLPTSSFSFISIHRFRHQEWIYVLQDTNGSWAEPTDCKNIHINTHLHFTALCWR